MQALENNSPSLVFSFKNVSHLPTTHTRGDEPAGGSREFRRSLHNRILYTKHGNKTMKLQKRRTRKRKIIDGQGNGEKFTHTVVSPASPDWEGP